MHPTLINIGPLPIHSYGLMLALSFIAAIFISSRRAEKAGISKNAIMDLAFWIIISAILGARLYYVILHPEEFKGHWLNTVNPFMNGQVGIGGLVMYGGVFGALLAGILYLRYRRLPVFKVADVLAPTVGFGIFLTRIGCFLNGCCYGKCTTHPFGVSFPASSPAGHFQHVMHCDALHPAQLYLSLGGLIIFLLIISLERFKYFHGFSLLLLAILYSIHRFIGDNFRHYTNDEMILGLTHNQFFCVVIIAISIVTWFLIHKRNRITDEPVAAVEPTADAPEIQPENEPASE